MADNKDLTIYQKLFYLFGQNKKPERTTPKYSFGDGDLITTQSKQDYDKQKLELQQQNYLESQWQRVDSELYQKAVYYETSRIASYMDYEAMEFTPEISAALDIMAEESCLIGSTMIPLLNGTNISIEDLYRKKYTNFWVYGIKIDENKIKPSIVKGVIYKGIKDVYKITLDDETEIKCTGDHKWLTFDNRWVNTLNLNVGDSLKSIYTKKSKNGYEKVSLTGFWKDFDLTHRIVAEDQLKTERDLLNENDKSNTQRIIIHHKSFNKLNNEPSQLEYMFWDDHQKLHTDLNSDRWKNDEYVNKMKKIFSETSKNTWSKLSKEERYEKRSKEVKNFILKTTKEERKKIFGREGEINGMFNVRRYGKDNPNYYTDKNHLNDINKEEYIKYISSIRGNRINLIKNKFNLTEQSVILFNKKLCEEYHLQRIEDINFIMNEAFSIKKIKEYIISSKNPKREFKKYCEINNTNPRDLRRFIKKRGYTNWSDIISTMGNHRVVKIEYIGKEKVYDLVGSSVDSTFGVSCNNGMIISHNCTPSEQGKVLTIQSNSKRVKSVLEDLFYNVLDIQTNLPMWTRNTCKYGDNFVYLKIDNKKGVLGSSQLTNIEIERREEGLFPTQKEGNTTQEQKKKQVIFHWREKAMDFNPWEVAHFRLLGDDRRLPYGTSVLEKARRIWKQMLLAEDAMLVYRVVRAPERRVFKIYVGNIDDKDVDAYIQKVANKFKRQQIVDQKSGQVDLRYNTLAVDQDYFVPVRDPNAPSPIDTLAGASNLDQIADIEYIQKKLLTALRVPKSFLGFDEAAGDGKNLALLDIRFARTINRIQQSMIQELNKLAIIHLFILGFIDDLNNFTLNLTNPSTQGEMLKVEQWKEKVLLYKDIVAQVDSGIAPASHTWAKKNIFNWSDGEIKTDLEQQMMERAAAKELENTPELIKKTGFFERVTKLYGEIGGPTPVEAAEGGEVEEGGAEAGGGFGGGGFGGGGLELGGEEGGFGGEETGGTEEAGGEETGGEGGGFGESFRYKNKGIIDKLLLEGRRKNEDIIMMTEGIRDLIGEEEENNNSEEDDYDLLQD